MGDGGGICFFTLKTISLSENVVPCSGINLVTCYAAKIAQKIVVPVDTLEAKKT